MEKTVKVRIFRSLIPDGKYFRYLSAQEISAIRYEIAAGISHVIRISDGENEMSAIITIENDNIHIRECDGSFITMRVWLKKYCDMLGSYAGKKKITFCTRKRGIAALAKAEFNFEEIHGW